MTTFGVEVVLKGRDFAVTETAIAGSFDIPQAQLDAPINRAIQFERMKVTPPVVH